MSSRKPTAPSTSTPRWRPSSPRGANQPKETNRMSSAPTQVLDTLPMTLPRLAEKKRLGEPIVMVTAYDHPSARVADAAGVDLVLVGDSAANVVLGYGSTVPVSVDEL